MPVYLTREGLPFAYDKIDEDTVLAHSWYVARTGRKFYVKSATTGEYLHRIILGLVRGDKRMADHISGCTIDNRRRNLRVVTARGNCYNIRSPKRNSTGFAGVSVYGKKFAARGRDLQGRRVGLGVFDTAEEAAAAYTRNFNMLHDYLAGEPV